MRQRFTWLFVLVFLFAAWSVSPALAHALLLRSTPEANAVLEKAPIQVELFFSEPLEPTLSSVQVFDSNNLRVDAGDVRVDSVDPTRMTVSLHSLRDGVYTVSWTVVSSIDGHRTLGSFPFGVGDENADAVKDIAQSTTARLPFSALLAKFMVLAALAILVGGRLFIWLVWTPALKADQDHSSHPSAWNLLYRFGLIALLLSIGLGILAQAGQTAGKELSLPWQIETGRILIETRLGLLWLFRLTLAIVAVWLATRKETMPNTWLGFTVNLALLLTVTLSSHAATEMQPLLPIMGDFLHLLGMTFWLGGLVYLFSGLRAIRTLDDALRTRLTSLLAMRFSISAVFFVGMIGLTGFYSAYLRVGSWPALWTSLYGHVLLVKQAFVAGLLIIAAINLFFISPRLNRNRHAGTARPELVSRFGKNISVDLMLAALLLASVSFLTYIPPARVVLPNSDLKKSTRVDDLKLELSISPGRVGQNTFTLKVTADGEPLQSARKVFLRFTSAQGNIPPTELELVGRGDGTFTAKGVSLSQPGNWQVQAVLRREDKFDAYANFDVAVAGPGSGKEASSLPRQAGVLLVLIGVASALLSGSIHLNIFLRTGIGALLALLTIILGVFQLTRPIAVDRTQINPIPPNSESIAAGQTIFLTHCAACHGETGKGDGPIGITLNPRPADLTQHAIPGVHTDAQLFEWITNGFPGSLMPAFKSTLSDTDRWHLVNFIRTFAPK